MTHSQPQQNPISLQSFITSLCILQSCLILSTDSLDNPNNPWPNTDQSPSITNWGTQASIPTIALWASTNTQWASGHPPPSTGPMIGPKPTIGFHPTLTLFP